MSVELQFTFRRYLFSVLLWAEQLGEGEQEWRGRLEYMTGRGARYLGEWLELINVLLEIFSNVDFQDDNSIPSS